MLGVDTKRVYNIHKPSGLCSGRYRDSNGVSCAVGHIAAQIRTQLKIADGSRIRSILYEYLGMTIKEVSRLEDINDNGRTSDKRVALLGRFCKLHPNLNWVE